MADDFRYYEPDRDDKSQWTLESGYSSTNFSVYPNRVLAAGARAGLFVLLSLYDQELDYMCRGPVQGFKVLLHTPGEQPRVSKHYFRVPTLQEVIVTVKPQMIQTSDRLMDYSPERCVNRFFFHLIFQYHLYLLPIVASVTSITNDNSNISKSTHNLTVS